MTVHVKALYGFSADLEPFVQLSPVEQVALLRSWGNTAIFGGYQNPEFSAAAHAAGMKVYAEIPCFMGADWWQKVPASRPITAAGQPLANDDWYYGVNPSVPQVRRELLAALEQLLTDTPLDGVWLDFIRWPCRWERPAPDLPLTSFDPDTLARFSRDTGIEIPQADIPAMAHQILVEQEAAWTAWRCQQITSWVAEARTILERVRPQAVLGLFGLPWRLSDHNGAILKIIGQDYRALARYVDIFSPMVYHQICGQPPEWIGAVTEEVRLLTGKPVWPIIQSVDIPAPLSAEAYAQALDAVLNSPAADGLLVFNLKGVLSEAKLAVTQARFL